MNREESIEQLNNLIEAWALNEADLNQLDIDALKLIIQENESLESQLSQKENKINEIREIVIKIQNNFKQDEHIGTAYDDDIFYDDIMKILEEENK